ncbi:MAG: protein translocase subunit SecD [Cellulomonadaceae bacterium]|nr:protein translocase subunit SecD [Cellulomonadaceae bacterium]
MASTPAKRTAKTAKTRPVRTIVTFTVLSIIVPFIALGVGIALDGRASANPDGASWAPALALDLEGGTQLILTPRATDGSTISDTQIAEAINVIRQRVDSSGVSEAEIASQGGQNIVVGIPGNPTQSTIDLVSQAAQLTFRPVLATDWGTPIDQDAAAPEGDSETVEPEGASPSPDAAASPPPDSTPDSAATPDASPTPEASPQSSLPAEALPSPQATPRPVPESPAPVTGNTDNPSDLAQITEEIAAYFTALDCSNPEARTGGDAVPNDALLVACSTDGLTKYILGPVEVEGTHITSASSGLVQGQGGVTTGQWGVSLALDSTGTQQFAAASQRLYDFGEDSVQNRFAITLDDLVVSAPGINNPITDGRAQITGSFDRETAATLANQLNYGSLPIQFEVQSQQQISATLGSQQLRNGLIAGLIGLALVVIYSMIQYRTLGLLTVASLVVAGLITYAAIALLSWGIGYRLSLPGVAGLIVAIGFTADSFIVYFERIRDELRNGRTLSYAVERGWQRARRTILAAKAVNLISAIILYYLAVGGVQGFAFTLGLTTIIDVMVVLWFTHPVMVLLSRIPFFRDGHTWSGLSRERLALSHVRYAGAGRITGLAHTAQDVNVEADKEATR